MGLKNVGLTWETASKRQRSCGNEDPWRRPHVQTIGTRGQERETKWCVLVSFFGSFKTKQLIRVSKIF